MAVDVHRFMFPRWSLPLSLTLAACGAGTSSSPPGFSPAIAFASGNSGDHQSWMLGHPLPLPLRVFVSRNGVPEGGATVLWSAATGGARLMSPATSVTGTDGIASSRWSLAPVPGTQIADAWLADDSTARVRFTATATPAFGFQVLRVLGDSQVGAVNTPLTEPLQVVIADEFGNPTGGSTVSWQVTAGSATVSPSSSIADLEGIASTIVTLGPTPGVIEITATIQAVIGSPVVFTARAQ